MTVAEAREREAAAQRELEAAIIARDALRLSIEVTERDLSRALAARKRVVGGVMPPDPASRISVSAARDAAATARARFKKAEERVRAAEHALAAAKRQTDESRQAVMDRLGVDSSGYVRVMLAEAREHEQRAAAARAEALAAMRSTRACPP
ncbi:MAG: hypothetical protein DCC71_12165 [Proteobacteria bacterium]|nr:MAG: hypothetical protein DCC71_12165 [Pseudomonadota bacterium]